MERDDKNGKKGHCSIMEIGSAKCSGRLGYSTASGIAFDAFNTSGFGTNLQRGPDGLFIDHNTVTAPTWDPAHVHGTWMMWLRGSITGLSITNNVYDPNGAVMGTNSSAGKPIHPCSAENGV